MPADVLEVQTQELSLRNVSSLPLSVNLEIEYPFSMVFAADDTKVTHATKPKLSLDVNETYSLVVQFDPSFNDDFHIRTIDEVLKVSYDEHPHVVSMSLHTGTFKSNIVSCIGGFA